MPLDTEELHAVAHLAGGPQQLHHFRGRQLRSNEVWPWSTKVASSPSRALETERRIRSLLDRVRTISLADLIEGIPIGEARTTEGLVLQRPNYS